MGAVILKAVDDLGMLPLLAERSVSHPLSMRGIDFDLIGSPLMSKASGATPISSLYT